MTQSPPLALAAEEASRLESLVQLLACDSRPEPLFDAIARQAAAACATPVAWIRLVGVHRQWSLARFGSDAPEAAAPESPFCLHAMAGAGLFEVSDTAADARFAGHPLVAEAPYLRYYASVPLTVDAGQRVGTLCVLDYQPRRLTAEQVRALQALAELAGLALQMRSKLAHQAGPTPPPKADAPESYAELQYRTIVEDQTELVSVASRDGVLVFVNRAYARHFGKRAEQLVGVSLFEFVEPSDRDAVRHTLDTLDPSGLPSVSENRMTDASGAERWVAWTNRIRTGALGEAFVHSVGRDVTDRRLAEDALRASQTLLERSGRIAGVGGWDLELGSGRVHWSEQTRRIHEVSDDFEPTLEAAVAFYAPEARAVIGAAVQRAIDTGQPWDLELPMITATGRSIWARAVGEVQRVGGVPVRLTGAFQDVTERHQLEQKLTDSERFLRQLADSLPVRIAYLDKDRRYRFVNQKMLRNFGRSHSEVLGHTRAELRPGESDAILGERARAALAGQTQQFEFEERSEGQLRRFENRLVPDFDAGGGVRGFFIAGIDITQRSAAEASLRELTAIIDNTTDYVVQTDKAGFISYLNASARKALGLTPDESVLHRAFSEFTTPQTQLLFARDIVPAVKAHGVWLGETAVLLQGGRAVPVSHMVLAHRDAQGRVERYSGILRDISEQSAARKELARQTETLRLVAEALPALVAAVGADLRYRFANSAFERWFGLPRAEIIGRSPQQVMGEAEFEDRLPWMRRALDGQEVSFQRELVVEGESSFFEITYVPVRLASGELDGFVAVSHDITRQKQEELRLKGLAQRDALTGLLNRAGFEEALEALRPSGVALAVLYVDLDYFKPVNDTYGHPVGDEVLRQFAQRLTNLVRPTDCVARLGGDEFAIAVPGLPTQLSAQGVADKVLAAAKMAFEVGPGAVTIDASVGVAYAERGTLDWSSLVERADRQLLAAKAGGRGRQSAETDPPATP